MNGWLMAGVIGLGAAVWIEAQNARIDVMERRAEQAEALLAAIEAQRENTARFDDIDRGLQDGGEDGLSDYMRGAAGKLWPAP